VLWCRRDGDTLDIALWVRSCRVIGRGVERTALRVLMRHAHAAGCTSISGRYRPTARNAMVADHYARLGFTRSDARPDGETQWTLAVSDAADDDPPPIDLIATA